MIFVEIRSKSSPDVEIDEWEPSAREEVCFLLEMEIAERGDVRCDLFQVLVATPEGLRALATPRGSIISDRATLVLDDFSWRTLHLILGEIVSRCAAEDWIETVLRLQRYFQWEFEDYTQVARPTDGRRSSLANDRRS